MGSSPITRSTSEQATYRLLRLFLQKARARSFCCSSSSGKRHARLACSLASALATARCRYHLFPGGGPAVPLGQNESISRGPVCVSVGLRLIPWFQRMTAGFPPPLDLQTGCVKARSRAPRLPHSISLFDQLCAEQSHPNRSLWNIGQNCDSRHRSACAISLFQPVARGIISIRSKLRLPPLWSVPPACSNRLHTERSQAGRNYGSRLPRSVYSIRWFRAVALKKSHGSRPRLAPPYPFVSGNDGGTPGPA